MATHDFNFKVSSAVMRFTNSSLAQVYQESCLKKLMTSDPKELRGSIIFILVIGSRITLNDNHDSQTKSLYLVQLMTIRSII